VYAHFKYDHTNLLYCSCTGKDLDLALLFSNAQNTETSQARNDIKLKKK